MRRFGPVLHLVLGKKTLRLLLLLLLLLGRLAAVCHFQCCHTHTNTTAQQIRRAQGMEDAYLCGDSWRDTDLDEMGDGARVVCFKRDKADGEGRAGMETNLNQTKHVQRVESMGWP